jgi:hypothetical protein
VLFDSHEAFEAEIAQSLAEFGFDMVEVLRSDGQRRIKAKREILPRTP